MTGSPGRAVENGAVAAFLVLTVLAFVTSQAFMRRRLQPVSNAGRPFVRDFAVVSQPRQVVDSEPFARIVAVLTWV